MTEFIKLISFLLSQRIGHRVKLVYHSIFPGTIWATELDRNRCPIRLTMALLENRSMAGVFIPETSS